MSKNKKLVNNSRQSSAITLLNKDELQQRAKSNEKPSVSITYLDYKGNYGIKNLHKCHHMQRGQRDILKELGDFLVKARKFKNINDLVSNFASHNGSKNKDDESIRKLRQIQKEHNIETSDMLHLHCCGGGNGQMVLHGFILGSCFEIVWIDPNHELHKNT